MSVTSDLARQFIVRAEEQGYKGKRRDDAAVEFFLGAYSMLLLGSEDEEAARLFRWIAMLLITRGFSAVEEAAARE